MSWKTLSGIVVPDILAWVRNATSEGQHLHIGTDSLQAGRTTQYVTVLVVHTPGKGGIIAYLKSETDRETSLRRRLSEETWRSIEMGIKASSIVGDRMTIHIDANPQPQHKSSAYVQELVGAVMGQGFAYRIKPESWCASHVADHLVRGKGILLEVAA